MVFINGLRVLNAYTIPLPIAEIRGLQGRDVSWPFTGSPLDPNAKMSNNSIGPPGGGDSGYSHSNPIVQPLASSTNKNPCVRILIFSIPCSFDISVRPREDRLRNNSFLNRRPRDSREVSTGNDCKLNTTIPSIDPGQPSMITAWNAWVHDGPRFRCSSLAFAFLRG